MTTHQVRTAKAVAPLERGPLLELRAARSGAWRRALSTFRTTGTHAMSADKSQIVYTLTDEAPVWPPPCCPSSSALAHRPASTW